MRGFRMAVTAAVASAMVVAAVAALEAMGAQETKGNGDDGAIAAFASCLRDHGVQVPALTGARLGLWLKTHEVPGDAARACKTAIGGASTSSDREAKADAAKAIGIDAKDLASELKAGKTVAQVAQEHNVDPQKVIDALVDAGTKRLQSAAEHFVNETGQPRHAAASGDTQS